MENNLDTPRENINQLETRFDQLRADVTSKLHKCTDCIKSPHKLRDEATETTNVLENKSTNASNEEKEWNNIKLKLTTTSLKGMVILNVGGEKYTTSFDTLTHVKDSFFTALFSEQWELERDSDDKSIFIDRNGKIFSYILEYLRTDVVPKSVMNNETLRHSLILEAEYFCLHALSDILKEAEQKHQKEKKRRALLRADKSFPNGTLLQREFKRELNELYGDEDQRWELIYKASRDGFDSNAFHTYCDNKGPTMTIILSNNNCLFGGYTFIPWTSDCIYKKDTKAFLFTLTNPHNIPATKCPIRPATARYAVYPRNTGGPSFGQGHDIYLSNDSNSDNSSSTSFPSSYIDTTGRRNETFTGARNFTAADIEVFKRV